MHKASSLFLYFFFFLLFITSVANAIPPEEGFYFKQIITVNKLLSIKESDADIKFKSLQESKLTPGISLGIGYYITPYGRVDLTLEPLTFYFYNESSSFNYIENGTLTLGTKSIKRKASGKAIMLNYYFDCVDKEYFKIFVGGGVGINVIKEKVSHLLSGNSTGTDCIYNFPLISETFTSKSKANFAYSLTVGTTIEVNPVINTDLSYSWRDLGIIKYKSGDLSHKHKYRGHYFSAALRFNL